MTVSPPYTIRWRGSRTTKIAATLAAQEAETKAKALRERDWTRSLRRASGLQVPQPLTQPFNLRYQEGNPTAPVDVARIVLQPLEITRTDRLARSVQHREK
jgi:hypothetical protein